MENGLFNNPNIMMALQQLSQSGQDSELAQVLRNLQISGQLGSFERGDVSGYNYGGRVGYGFPIGEGLFSAGVSGQGYKADTPMGTFRDSGLTGADLGYKWDDKDLSMSYNQTGGTGGVPLWQLLFSKYF
jgi:hypothetical protein